MTVMKMYMSLFLSLFLAHISAQTVGNIHFLFDEYQQARVYQSNGRYSNELVNFCFEDNKLYFVDSKDGKKKVVSEDLMIVSFWIGDRVFIPITYGLKEILHDNGFRLFLHYNTKRQSTKSNLLYGGDNSVASVNTYTDFRGTGLYNFRSMSSEISKIYPSYSLLVKNGRERVFANSKSFLKAIPASKRKAISEYIASKQIDFEQPEMVLKLCIYVFNNE